METTLHFDTTLSLSELAQILREQLPAKDRQVLVEMLKEDNEVPSKEHIISQLKDDYIAHQEGTLKTRSLKDVLNEL